MSRALIVETLEKAAEAGDLFEPVYAALLARHPEFAPHFALDTDKSVRGEMLQTALEYILLYTDESPSLDAQLAGTRSNHLTYDIEDEHFMIFFEVIRDIVAGENTKENKGAWHDEHAKSWDDMLAYFAAIKL